MAMAEGTLIDGFYYNLTSTSTTKTAVLTYESSTSTKNYPDLEGEVIIPPTVVSGGVTYNVTDVKAGAFKGCANITKVTFPSSLTKFLGGTAGNTCFSGCTSLEEVVFEPGSTMTSLIASALNGATNLKRVTLPSKLTSITASTFEGYAELEEVVMPSTVTSIKEKAFYKCAKLAQVEIPSGVTSIGTSAFAEMPLLTQVTLPTGLTTLSASAFSGDTGLQTITLPAGIKVINANLFDGCSSLASITMQASITKVDSYAFRNCTSLTSFTLPTTLTTLGASAFEGCTSLRDINLTGATAMTTIGASAFKGCTSLTSVELLAKVSTTGLGANAFQDCTSLQTADISKFTGTSVPNYLFAGCTSLNTIKYNETKVTSIGEYAFSGCTALKSFNFTTKITSVGKYAFAGSGLEEVTMPSGLTGANAYVFANCLSLKKATVPASTYSTGTYIYFGNNCFSGCTSLTDIEYAAVGSTNKVYRISGNSVFEGCTALETLTFPTYITTLDASLFTGATGLKNLIIPESVKTLSTATAPTSANNYFADTKIERLVLPSSLVTIGKRAFQNMPELQEVVLPPSMTDLSVEALFYGCPKLNSVVFPEGLVSITAANAFEKCTGLEQVNFPKSLTTIKASNIFDGAGLKTLTFSDGITDVRGYQIFANNVNLTEVTLGKNMTYIYDKDVTAAEADKTNAISNCFQKCTSLTTVNFPAEMTKFVGYKLFAGLPIENINIPENSKLELLGRQVFAGTTALKNVTLPASLKTIMDGAFMNNPTLETVTMNGTSDIETAGYGVFMDCLELTSVNMGDNHHAIGNSWFRNCHKLVDLKLPAELTHIGSSAFLITANKTAGVVANPELNITYNEKLEVLGDSCFLSRTGVMANLPATMKSIGERVFYQNANVTNGVFNCPGLTTIGEYAFFDNAIEGPLDFSNTSLETVGQYAFTTSSSSRPTKYTEIIFPETIKSIGAVALRYSSNAKRLVFYSQEPPKVDLTSTGTGNCCFGGTDSPIYDNAILYAPPTAYKTYIAQSHFERFHSQNGVLREHLRPITSVEVSNVEIARWLPAEPESLAATVKYFDEAVDNAEVVWTTTDESVVSVDDNGTVTFNGIGQAFVQASYIDPTFGRLTSVCRVNVYDHLYDMAMKQPAAMYPGDVQQLVAEVTDVVRNVYVDNVELKWNVETPGIVTVDKDGNATAIAAGTVAVTASWTDEKGEIHSVTRSLVVMPEDAVNFYDEKAIIIRVGSVHEFATAVATHRGVPVDNGEITWESGNSDVAMVSSTGRIFGCKPGAAHVYAIYNGVKTPCTVTVIEDGMYNLTLDVPGAHGYLHMLGLNGQTHVQLVGDEFGYGYWYHVSEATHDGKNILEGLVDEDKSVEHHTVYKPYTVNGPLDGNNEDPAMLMALAANADASAYVPYTTLKVAYDIPYITGVDDMTAPEEGIRIYAHDGKITIVGATEGALVTICDASGKLLYQGYDHEIPMAVNGILLLNVDNANFKFVLK